MSDTAREMTYEEQVANFIINVLALDIMFCHKRDLIGLILGLSYRHERELKDALYTQTPSCTLKAEEGEA